MVIDLLHYCRYTFTVNASGTSFWHWHEWRWKAGRKKLETECLLLSHFYLLHQSFVLLHTHEDICIVTTRISLSPTIAFFIRFYTGWKVLYFTGHTKQFSCRTIAMIQMPSKVKMIKTNAYFKNMKQEHDSMESSGNGKGLLWKTWKL